MHSSLVVQPLASHVRTRIASSKIGSRASFDVGSRTTSKVSLRVASVEVGQLDGRVAIEWDTTDKREALLDDEPYASGKTKMVYQVRSLLSLSRSQSWKMYR